MTDRRGDIAANLTEVHGRIAAAARAAGRPEDSVTLVAVGKTWPAEDLRLAVELGVRHLGENRDQEAAPKAAALADLQVVWHFIGQLQTNKARSVARYAHVVESVDRPRLVAALSHAAQDAGRTVSCLLQVSLDGAVGRGGALPADLPWLADQVAASPGLRLGGLMAVAPLEADPLAVFGRLADLATTLRADHPEAVVVSAGMSHDLEAAVACGATHVRVGTAVFGPRG